MHRLLLTLCLTLLFACAPRGEMTLVPPAQALGDAETVFVGSTRVIDPATGRFGNTRSETTRFARYTIAVPPERPLGAITWPKRGHAPDPQHDFLTTEAQVYANEPGFRADLSRALRRDVTGPREATIFVHGFNTTFAEGLYRIAQLSHDLDLPGVAVHYAWPSAGTPLGYVRDRDSALFARRGLDALIREISRAGADRIFIVVHSMGGLLLMEVLRDLALRGDRGTLGKIAGVILISPDIDVDVFRAQAEEIGTLPRPFLIFGSDRDRVLRLSARLTGQRDRLGSLKTADRVADLEVTLVDVAAFDAKGGHFTLGNSEALIKLLGRIGDVNAAFDADRAGRIGLLSGVVLTVQNATQIILSPVAALGNGPFQTRP